nr:hypothetical protein [Tanacetum cinerariifolium]
MDGCTKGPQLEEDENLNTGAPGTGRTPTRGTSAPAGQAQRGPSPAFVKENIDVLRTMTIELDNRGQKKVISRKLFNEDSGGARSENSQTSPSAEEIGGYSFDGSSRSRSRDRSRSVRKHRKSVSRKKRISKSHWSVRSEARNISNSKSVKSKPQSMKASRRKSSSDSGYDTVFDNSSEDLSMPYRRPKPMPFTSRITRFRYHRRAKLPPNVRVYKGNNGLEDHLSICLSQMSKKSGLCQYGARCFARPLQKRYDKDPTEIHGIKRKPNEWLQAFMDSFKEESAHIKGVPSVLRISAFMHGDGCPELAKKLNGKIPKTVDEMWERVRAFISGETKGEGRSMMTYAPYSRREGFTLLTKTPKEILAMDNVNFPPPLQMVGTPEKRNMNKFCDYHQDRGHNTNDCYHLKKQIEEAVASGRLAHLVKISGKAAKRARARPKQKRRLSAWVRRIYVDGGSSSEIMYEHFFRNLSYRTRSRLRESRNLLVGFSGEVNPLGVIDLEVTIGECGRTRTVMMEFAVVKSPSPYNALLGRTGMRSLEAIEEAQALSRNACVTDPSPMQTSSKVTNPRVSLVPMETRSWRLGKEPMQLDDVEERRQPGKGKKLPKSSVEKKIVVNDNYPEQLVTIGGANMTGILRAITKHNLDTYPHIEPKVQKKRSLASDRMKVLTDEVNEWLKAGRHIDSAFKEQIGVNLEAYVDDMMIKSRIEQDIIKDIEQTLCTLRRINMKLNPKKSLFDMEEGKFLGYIVTSKGIRANPEKTKAVMDIPLPRTLKQMQSLKAVEAAFLEMKKLVSELPTLTTPKKGETLMMYLAAANEAVSAVLFTKRDGRQTPIDYVITDSPIGQVLNNSGASGRLAKWAIELGAYGITYLPRLAVKGHVLADFLADTSTKINATPEVSSTPRVEDIPKSLNARENLTPGPRAWRLYTDGASNNRGSRAGIILIAPDDVEYSYALCLNFSNSNNDAEYEALLAGLHIATEMQVKEIHDFVDSKAENRKADALSKLATVQFDHLFKEVLVEVLNEHCVEAQEVNMVVEEEGPTWMTPIRNYLEKGILPEDPVDARTLMEKPRDYTMENGVLYRKSYLVPLMRCVGPLQANYVIREVHMGSYGMHDGPRQVLAKAMNLGYYWPSMHKDARELIRAWYGHSGTSPRGSMKGEVSNRGNRLLYQMDGVERANRSLLRGIKTRLDKGGPAWADEELRLNLDLLEERREIAAIKEAKYKQHVEKYYNKKQRAWEQTLLPFAHNNYSPVNSYTG